MGSETGAYARKTVVEDAELTRLHQMIISKQNRRTIYESLFKEGVMVAPKDFEVKHPELDLPNLEVIKACQSLTSRGYVHTQFSWQWYFYTLTNEVRTMQPGRLVQLVCLSMIRQLRLDLPGRSFASRSVLTPFFLFFRVSNTSASTFTCPPRSFPLRTSALLVLSGPSVVLVRVPPVPSAATAKVVSGWLCLDLPSFSHHLTFSFLSSLPRRPRVPQEGCSSLGRVPTQVRRCWPWRSSR